MRKAVGALLAGAVLAGCGSGGSTKTIIIKTTTVTKASSTSSTPSTTTSRPTLSCDGPTASHLKHYAAPRNCEILYPNFSLDGGVQLERLRWSHWGAGTATATGVSHGFHMAGPAVKITVKVWRLRHSSCTGGSWYTRLRMKVPSYGTASNTYNTAYC